jgi:hypothetical protein
MKKIVLFFMAILLLGVGQVSGLLGFDEYTDETPQTIEETVENELGNTCTDCNVSIWLYYPNGTLHTFQLMPYNASSTKYQATVNMTIVNGNTTLYTARITANRTSGSKLINGTSDRTIITVYDVYPPADSQWDVGLVLILMTLQGLFIFIFLKYGSVHIAISHIFAGLAVGMNMVLFRVGDRILATQGVTNTQSYIFVFLIYYTVTTILRAYNESQAAKKANKLGFG